MAGEPDAVPSVVLKRTWFATACLLGIAAAAALLSGGAWAAGQYRIAPDPAWVEASPPVGDAAPQPAVDGSRFLLVDDQVNLLGRQPVWHRTLVEEVVQERALASAARLSIDFQPAYQQVELHAVEIERDGERIDRSGRADVQVLRRESDMESGILDGRLTVQVTIPDVRVGDRVEYRFSVIGANPIFGSDYHDVYAAAYGVPLAERRLRFVYPVGLQPEYRSGRGGYRVTEGGGEGWRSVEFRASGLPRITRDDNTPDWHDTFGRLEFSTLADWPAVAEWARPLYPARLQDRTLAAEMVELLELDRADPRGSLERAIAFVQGGIRYTAIDMGSYSHAPNAPELVLERRFGDCKDKSSLLVALLAEAGIEAEPVLVNTVLRANVGDRLPSPLAFDHVVVRARTPDGDAWIDATRGREQAPLAAREPLPFRAGLPVYSGGGLVGIPAPPPEQPVVEVNQRIRLDRDGSRASALFGVVTDYRRAEATDIRAQYEDTPANEIGDRYLSYMRGFYDDIASAAVPSAGGTAEPGVVRTVESYRLDWDVREAGAFGIVLFQLGDWLPRLGRDARTTPLLLGGPAYATQTIRLDFPRGWNVTPETERIRNPWFTFERRVEVEDGDLVVTGSWHRHVDDVPAADYPRFRGDVDAARDLLVYQVTLGPGALLPPTRPADWAWPALALLVFAGMLAVAWSRRRSGPLAGMLFAPRLAMAKILAAPRWWPVAVLVGAVSLVGLAWNLAALPDYAPDERIPMVLLAIAGAASTAIWFLVHALLLKGCFHLLSVRAPLRPMLQAVAWASVPYLLAMLATAAAMRGRLEGLGSAGAPKPADMPALLVVLLLGLIGTCWSMVASVNTLAVAAGTGRAKALGALALTVLLELVFIAVLALLAGIAYFALGGAV